MLSRISFLSFISIRKLSVLTFLFWFSIETVDGQQPADCSSCACTMPAMLGITLTTVTTHGSCDPLEPSTFTLDANRYARFWGIAGNRYSFSFCSNTANTIAYITANTFPGVIMCDQDGCGITDGPSTVSFTPSNTGTYRLYVFNSSCGVQYPAGTMMDVQLTCTTLPVPSNNLPCGAISLDNTNCDLINGDNIGATNSNVPVPSCGNYQGRDLWYTITVPTSGFPTIQTEEGTLCAGAFTLYTADDCANTAGFIELPNSCSTSGLTGLDPEPALVYDAFGAGLVAGDEIYVRYWERNGNENGTFSICGGPIFGTSGSVYWDANDNCVRDAGEEGIAGSVVVIQPGNIVAMTNASGNWLAQDLPVGDYTITTIPSGPFGTACVITQSFSVVDPAIVTTAPSFGWIITDFCAQPNVSMSASFLRRCFDRSIHVSVCNQNSASGVLADGVVDIQLPDLLIVNSATAPYTDLGNNLFQIELPVLMPGACSSFYFNATVSCDAVLGQTLCMSAELVSSTTCEPEVPTEDPDCAGAWDGSDLKAEGICTGDSVIFTITNISTSDMICYSEVRIFIDGVMVEVDSVLLVGGGTAEFAFAATGETFTLQVDQHPMHPFSQVSTWHVELCGPSDMWSFGIIGQFPLNDDAPTVDEFCGLVMGSFDPNDKAGSPAGLGEDHEILPGQRLEYMIRFQNTGNDTAFTVVIRDTLSMDLDIFSVVPGVSSHQNTFTMHGPRVLEWRFDNILLADSNVNEPASHGFVVFQVDQVNDLPLGTVINNTAAIYFDFNEPVITNTTFHMVNVPQYPDISTGIAGADNTGSLQIWPNPNDDGTIYFNWTASGARGPFSVKILDPQGREVWAEGSIRSITGGSGIILPHLTSGLYLVDLQNADGHRSVCPLIIE